MEFLLSVQEFVFFLGFVVGGYIIYFYFPKYTAYNSNTVFLTNIAAYELMAYAKVSPT